MRKVFLDDLPKIGKYINWKESVGYKVKFIYDYIEGEVEIVDYYINDKGKIYLIIKYKDRVKPIYTS